MENLLRGAREHREIASLAEQIEKDYHGRFLVELLQNANDQAIAAGRSNSTVAVVRTEGLLAVLNQGEPFNDDGLRDITSIGLSRKPPDTCLGNKGIGFKAVFEVCRSPEIFSAPHAGASLTHSGGTRFRFDLDPFLHPESSEKARQLISPILEERNGDLTVDKVLNEARRAAPFKYPLPLPQRALDSRLSDLGVSADMAHPFQTLVVLPFAEEASEAVDVALGAMLDQGGATVLFLDGVGRIEYHAQHQGTWWELGRKTLESAETLERGARLERIHTWKKKAEAKQRHDEPSWTVAETTWWRIRRDVGSPVGTSREDNEQERRRLRDTLVHLPGEVWKQVERAPVAVALPRGDASMSPGEPLGAEGKLCIGLPTEQRAGTPVWLHSHFHGNISRTDIDLTLTYNRLLFEEGLRLLDTMLDRLRDASDIVDRRLVTLAMERSDGPVAAALYEDGDVGKADVVLAADGESYISAQRLAVPSAEDIEIFRLLLGEGDRPSDFGFVLPEDGLLANARTVLEHLAGKKELTEGSEALFIRRGEFGVSLLERGAERNRSEGPEFWAPFLEWVVDRFSTDDVSDQRILPVASDGLLSPGESVFFPPSSGPDDPDIKRLLTGSNSMPDLPFFDERAIPVRRGDRDYTSIARRLAPEHGRGLVRRPDALHVINYALVPYMETALADPPDQDAALAALRMVLTLTDGIDSKERRERIHRDRLRVPVTDAAGGWNWISPEAAYFGSGWVGETTDQLLEKAYGGQGRRLIPWSRFESLVSDEDDKEVWVRRMTTLGVSQAPKRRTPAGTHAAPLRSYSKHGLTRDGSVPPPFPELEDFWVAYLEDIRHGRVSTKSGQPFDIDEVVWIDGLERPSARAAVVDLMLRHPNEHFDATQTVLGRVKRRRDRRPVPTLWAHALRNSDWEVIPTTQGRACPQDAWLVSARRRSGTPERYRLLPVVRDSYRSAAVDDLLGAIGVRLLEEAGVDGLVHALHQLARDLGDLSAEQERSARALASELYHNIQMALGENQQPSGLERIIDEPVPLLRNGLEVFNLQDVDAVYLDDDPTRGVFVQELADSPRIPSRARDTYGRLISELRKVMGEHRVLLTSTVPVHTGFEPLNDDELPLLCAELEATFAEDEVQLDMAAILAFCGRDPLDPGGDRFHQHWDDFQRTRIQRGTFPSSAADRVAFFDRRGSDDPILQLSAGADRVEMLRSTWQIFGQGHRDAIALYAQIVAVDGNVRRFFAERKINEEEFRRLRDVVASSAVMELERAKGLALVLARRQRSHLSVDDFEVEWDPSAASKAGWSEIGSVPVDILRSFGRAVLRGDEKGLAELLSAAGVYVKEWQAARNELGMGPWKFKSSNQRYETARDRLVSEIMATAARRPSVDRDRCRSLVEALRQAPIPRDVALAPASEDRCRRAAVATAASVAAAEDRDQDGLLTLRLTGELKMGSSFLPKDIPEREVSDYRHSPPQMRSHRAKERLSDILDLAEALSETKGEVLDRNTIMGDSHIEELTTGWLASPFALAPVLREKLVESVPRTAKALIDAGAFREPVPKPELWGAFPEIVAGRPRESSPQQTFTIFGKSRTMGDIDSDLASAANGELGATIRRLTSRGLNLEAFHDLNRPSVTLPAGTRRGGGGGGSSQSQYENDRVRKLHGLLGEAFVFEGFRQELPGFDSTCWVSANRARYGLAAGSDEEGFDFFYVDAEGKLTGHKGAACEIEVKATSQTEPKEFTLTRNEMGRARACHGADHREYVIIWVANVRDRPKLYDVLIDPFGLWLEERVYIAENNLRVRVPRADESAIEDAEEGG